MRTATRLQLPKRWLCTSTNAHPGSSVTICQGTGVIIGSPATGGSPLQLFMDTISRIEFYSGCQSNGKSYYRYNIHRPSHWCEWMYWIGTVTVAVNTLPSVTASPATSICPGSSTLIFATATGGLLHTHTIGHLRVDWAQRISESDCYPYCA